MQLIPLGDCAVLVVFKASSSTLALAAVSSLARSLKAMPLTGVTDIVPAYTTVAVHYNPATVVAGNVSGGPFETVANWIRTAPSAPPAARRAKPAREVVVPVCYGGEGGPDIAAVAARAKCSEAEVIRLHAKGVYHVAAVGFSPGFPYLLGLPPRLAMPRRTTPRVRVPAGSVGIGGIQAGIYPTATPGGWAIIGCTPVRLFRPENEAAPTLLEPGDTVRFVPITKSQAVELEPAPVEVAATAQSTPPNAVFEVIKAGALTTVQDLGRNGHQYQGIPVGGAMDRESARVANILLGNDENAPLLEASLTGPELTFLRDTWIAVTGADIRGVPGWRPWRVSAGQRVSLADFTRGAFAYIAFAGGLDIKAVLGGASTLLRSGIGGWQGRALQAGDCLGAHPNTLKLAGNWSASAEFNSATGDDVVVRFMRGPQWSWFSAESHHAFVSNAFKTTMRSDRMGVRLEGPSLQLEETRELVSEAVGFGSVQVPPDGQPIVLMADRQTLGGYPKIGHVIAVDLPRLAQVKAGAAVHFMEASIGEAQSLFLKKEHSLTLLKLGVRAKFLRA